MTLTIQSCIPETWTPCTDPRDPDTILNESNAKYHHTAKFLGYVSRKIECELFLYKGRFGTGFIVAYPNYKSTLYCYIDYFIVEGMKK